MIKFKPICKIIREPYDFKLGFAFIKEINHMHWVRKGSDVDFKLGIAFIHHIMYIGINYINERSV